MREKEPKRVRGDRAVIAVIIISAMLLQGCGLFKPTAVSLMAKMLKNVQNVTSAEANVKVGSELNMSVKTLNIGMDVNLQSDSDIELTKNPERTKENTTLSISGLGQNVDTRTEQYTEKAEDGSRTAYKRTDGGNWTKSVAKAQEKEEKQDLESKWEGLNPVLGLFSIIQKAGNEIKDAELKEDLVTVNDKEAYQINFPLSGTLLKELLTESNVDFEKSGIDIESIDWDSITVPTELYIYKKGYLPARIKLDCVEAGKNISGSLIQKGLEGTMFEGVELEFRTLTIDASFDKYNEIDEIVIPDEAYKAEEADKTDDLVPDLTTMFTPF